MTRARRALRLLAETGGEIGILIVVFAPLETMFGGRSIGDRRVFAAVAMGRRVDRLRYTCRDEGLSPMDYLTRWTLTASVGALCLLVAVILDVIDRRSRNRPH